jgi:protein involved in ribonucleotide reduction
MPIVSFQVGNFRQSKYNIPWFTDFVKTGKPEDMIEFPQNINYPGQKMPVREKTGGKK